MSQRTQRSGFSLVELLVVMLMGTVLLGLILPKLYAAQQAQANRETMNHLKQLVLACHNYNATFKKLPPAFEAAFGLKEPASVHVYLLPFIEEDLLYKKFLNGEKPADARVATFLAPDDPSSAKKEDLAGIQNFAANLRVLSDKGIKTKYDEDMPALGKTEPGNASIPRTFRDGTSNTILFATKYAFCGEEGGSRYASAPNTKTAAFFGQNAAKVKAHPSDKTATFQLRPEGKDCCCSPLMAQSFTKDGMPVAIADGVVRLVSPNLTPGTWNAAVQPNDGQVLGPDW
jgi:prepilin-type N-terminal cleavage/methylation domain-containing protein